MFFAGGRAAARVAIVPLGAPLQPGVVRGDFVARARVLAVSRGWPAAVGARLPVESGWERTARDGAQPCSSAYRRQVVLRYVCAMGKIIVKKVFEKERR